MTASGGTTTGTNTTYTATVTDKRPVAFNQCRAHGAVAHYRLACFRNAFGRTCSTSGALSCDLGGLSNGGSATVTFVVQQISAGTATMNVEVSGSENDPTTSNNAAIICLSSFMLPTPRVRNRRYFIHPALARARRSVRSSHRPISCWLPAVNHFIYR